MPTGGEIVSLPLRQSEPELLAGLRQGAPWARAALIERFGGLVERVVRRILGNDRHTERADIVHDVFVEVFASAHRLREPAALPGFVQRVAVHTACRTIRRRRARGWLRFLAPQELPDAPVEPSSQVARQACRRVYAALDALGAEERAAFALRFIEGMELTEVAAACGVSLATIKRRLGRAEARFVAVAANDPALEPWLRGGTRWKT